MRKWRRIPEVFLAERWVPGMELPGICFGGSKCKAPIRGYPLAGSDNPHVDMIDGYNVNWRNYLKEGCYVVYKDGKVKVYDGDSFLKYYEELKE